MWKHDNECKHINSNLANSNAKQHLGSASFVLVLTEFLYLGIIKILKLKKPHRKCFPKLYQPPFFGIESSTRGPFSANIQYTSKFNPKYQPFVVLMAINDG